MVGFRMDVVPSRLPESSIRIAQIRLRLANRFGRVYLGESSRTIQTRGLKVFNETGNNNI